MRILTALFILITFTAFYCIGQENTEAEERQQQLDSVLILIRDNKIVELAGKVSYPLRRDNPIPDIKNKDEFILYYPVLIDSAFRAKLIYTKFDLTNTIDRYPGLGLFHGDIWFNEDWKIVAINYQSEQEKKLLEKLQGETEKKIHHSVKPWESNVLVCKTDTLLIRIDLMKNDIRFIAWKQPKTIAEQPDLILFNGDQQFQGTMGGMSYTFKDKEFTYEIDRVDIAETDEGFGLFLRTYKDDKEVTSCRCIETK